MVTTPAPVSRDAERQLGVLTVLSGTMGLGSTAKVLAKCKLKYYRISECLGYAADPGDAGGRWQ